MFFIISCFYIYQIKIIYKILNIKNLHFTKSLFSLFLLFVLSTGCQKSNPEEPVSLKQLESVKKQQEIAAKEEAEAKKVSGKAKLKALGLTDAEIEALVK